MVLDRQGSYTRPVIGLVRCVCKDETDQTGRSSPIKMRICNLHFFAPIWMAQPIVHNFRRMSLADLKPREPGFINYEEGWASGTGEENTKKKRLRVMLWAAYASWLQTTISNHFTTKIGDQLNTLQHREFFCCERLSASMARSLRLELYLYTAVDSRPGPGGSRTTASCQP